MYYKETTTDSFNFFFIAGRKTDDQKQKIECQTTNI